MRLTASTAILIALALGYSAAQRQSGAGPQLPNDPSAFKFAVIGNSGTGEKAQYELADQMATLRDRFDYRTVILLGGNIQGGQRPEDFMRKFELPYGRLLKQGVEFRAVLGNGDSREQRFYKLFNMKGEPFYTFSPAVGIQCFALETTNVFVRQASRFTSRVAESAGAALRQIQGQRCLHRPRELLRAHHTATRNLVLRRRLERNGQARRHRSRQRPHGECVRSGSGVPGRGDRRRHDELQRDLARWADGRHRARDAQEVETGSQSDSP